MPSKEAAPLHSTFHRHDGRHACHLCGVLPHCDERPSRGRPIRGLRRQDVGSCRWHPTDTCKHCVSRLRDSNPDNYLLLSRGGDRVPYARVLLQVTMCPRSQGRALSFAGAPIAQFEEVRLLGPTFVRLPAQASYVKNAVVLVVAQMATAYAAGGGGAEKLLGPFEITDDHTEEVKVRTLVHLPYRFVPLALDQQLTPRAAWTVLVGAILSEGGGLRGAVCAAPFIYARCGGGRHHHKN